MALKCKLLYPVAVQSHHEIINYITLQALSAKMGTINSGLSLEVTSLWVVWIFGFGLVLFLLLLLLFNKFIFIGF